MTSYVCMYPSKIGETHLKVGDETKQSNITELVIHIANTNPIARCELIRTYIP